MKNIIITELKDGYYRLTPKKGYILRNKLSYRQYSEAVTKAENENAFEAIKV